MILPWIFVVPCFIVTGVAPIVELMMSTGMSLHRLSRCQDLVVFGAWGCVWRGDWFLEKARLRAIITTVAKMIKIGTFFIFRL